MDGAPVSVLGLSLRRRAGEAGLVNPTTVNSIFNVELGES